MDKNFILAEIKRAVASCDGKPLGTKRFEKATGIRLADWFGKYWRNWGEALTEAGFAPNQFQGAYEEEYLLGKFIVLMREIGRFPVQADLKMKARQDPTFPSHSSFARLGKKIERLKKIRDYCSSHTNYDDILRFCLELPIEGKTTRSIEPREAEIGYVYLIKSGRYYKIGKSNSVGRRERELAIQLPERADCVHSIRTDDPPGIEAYWHRRFSDKRKNGEWFLLSPSDVVAFKRRKFM